MKVCLTFHPDENMKQPNYKNKELYLFLGLIALVIVLLAFKSNTNSKNTTSTSIFDQALAYNHYYEKLPERYRKVVQNEPSDIVLGSDEAYLEKIKALKYDAHVVQNGLYREVVLIKKVTLNDTLIEPMRIDIYPSNMKDLERRYLTFYKIKSIHYSYNGSNYLVAKQILPNIEINKIVPYTKNWKSTILEVDNSILYSRARNNSEERIAQLKDSLVVGLNNRKSGYDFLFEKALQDNAISYLSSDENLTNLDISTVSESFKTYTKENDLRLIYVSDDIAFWDGISKSNKVQELNYLFKNGQEIQNNIEQLVSRNITFEEVFDIEKLTTYYALMNLYSNRNENSLYLNFNEDTGLLEPYFLNENLGQLNTFLKNIKNQDLNFLELYAKQLLRFADLRETQDLMGKYSREIKELLQVIHQAEPTSLFDKQLFVHNKLIMEKALNPSTATKIALVSYDEKKLEVEVSNLANFPLKIEELSFKQNKFITSPQEENLIIMPLEKRKVIFNLPDSYDNLFVQKKKKTAGFVFEKDIFNLSIGYRLVGTSGMKYNTITPFEDLNELSEDDDFLRTESDLSQFKFIQVDEENRQINFTSDSLVLNSPLVLPAGYEIIAKSGLRIDIKAGGKLISKSPLKFVGSEENLIKIYSSDGKGQGIFVVSAGETSELKYVEFDNLTNPAHGLWDLTGAVVFYESPVNLNHVLFANNSCEDGLNIIRTNFTMKNTTFRNTQSDAFDGDFVQGTLTKCTFENLGNDAVDVSGSKLEMYDLKILKAGDKALSAGEDSQMKVERIAIDQCEIAIAGKDLSIVEIKDATITNSKLGFTAFQKKPEFGASSITAENVTMTQVETAHLIENKSSLVLNGKQAETIEAVKEQMYGVEFGVDSKETRVKITQ